MDWTVLIIRNISLFSLVGVLSIAQFSFLSTRREIYKLNFISLSIKLLPLYFLFTLTRTFIELADTQIECTKSIFALPQTVQCCHYRKGKKVKKEK